MPRNLPGTLLLCFSLAIRVASAQFTPVFNTSFETADLPLSVNTGPFSNIVPGSTLNPTSGTLANWTASSTIIAAAAGAFAPISGGPNWTTKWWTGNNVGYLQISGEGTVFLTQRLPIVLQSDTTYNLSALVGRRSSTPHFNYGIQLSAGTTVLSSASNLLLDQNASGMDSLSYSSGPNNPLAGQPLVITLSCIGVIGELTEVFFDDITLTGSSLVKVGAVISASGYGGFTSVAPGSWVEIYGENLASDSRGWGQADFNGVNAPTSLDGTSVSVGGLPAFVDYISPGQVNVLLPSNLGTGPQQLTVTAANGMSAPFPITVNALEPGLLATPSFDIKGTQYTIAFFPDGTYVLPAGSIAGLTSRGAKPGEIVILYGIGFGPVTPDTPAGQLAQGTSSLTGTLQVFVGGMPAQVDYAGLAPGFTGLYQFNITVPNVQASAAALTFTLNGTSGTQTLHLAVD